jgi:2-methylcitrate dehydratase PrpD
MKGVTKTLAEFITNTTFKDLPEKVVHEAKRNLLDTIGCALGGLTTDVGFESLALARSLGGKPESTILGTGEKTSCAMASYVNSRMANALDADDTFPIPAHFANSTMGATLAMGERQNSSGEEIITAYVLGYELASRIGVGMRLPLFLKENEIGIYPPLYCLGVFSVFGSLGAAAKLLHLSSEQVQHTLGIGGTSCPIPVHGKWGESAILPTLKYGDVGWYAQLGVTSSLLAAIGTTGYNTILDGNEHFWRAYGIDSCDFEGITHNLGRNWCILDTTYKPWPSCRYTHYPLWLFLKIKNQNQLSFEDIEKVSIKMGHMGTGNRFRNQNPTGMISCQFNHPHAIAMGALGIEVGPKWYSRETMECRQVVEFRKKVEVQHDPELDKIDLPPGKVLWKLPTTIDVLAKGNVFRAFTEYTKGDPWTKETYFADEELKRKFISFASSVFSGSEKWNEQMRSVTDLAFKVEELPSITELINSLSP